MKSLSRLSLPFLVLMLAWAALQVAAWAADPCTGAKRVICFGGVSAEGGNGPGSCRGTISFKTGCVQPMFGGQ